MPPLTPAELAAADALIDLALAEDLGDRGDITSEATIPAGARLETAWIVARAKGVLAGLPVVERLANRMGLRVPGSGGVEGHFWPIGHDGMALEPPAPVATVGGSIRTILAFERTALNFLQHMSGVATLAARFVAAVSGTKAEILDTRKTLPGWRLLEKYAVRCGGGQNHRIGLYDAILIKDNHLAHFVHRGDPIAAAVAAARAHVPPGTSIEVEVDSLGQLDQALACAPDIILVDNFDLARLREAVRRRNAVAPAIRLEASGGVNLETVRTIAETGVDRISAGALTHSAPALDLGLDFNILSRPPDSEAS
ncbi:MAG TPA: carboxylating nicotinate-nucleotide diphosphorylase [Isosphaeraceae bacterium]|jgi:nicotinate-nucleotide pyrophosphorylase (carboxylating)